MVRFSVSGNSVRDICRNNFWKVSNFPNVAKYCIFPVTTRSIMRKYILFLLLLFISSFEVEGQSIALTPNKLTAVQVMMKPVELDGRKTIRVTKDTAVTKDDEATFVRINDLPFHDGTIEVNVLSRLLPDAPAHARGFIGVAFRISEKNERFECIYIRPTNGRAEQQLRRNRSVQYFSFPDFKYDRLRKESAGEYESYADMGLNEWIRLRIEVKGSQAKLFINNQPQPSLIVNDLKLGENTSGAIGLFVDIGTEGFFTDLIINKQ